MRSISTLRSIRFVALTLGLLVALSASAAVAQTSLELTVVDPKGKKLGDVAVTILEGETEVGRAVTTKRGKAKIDVAGTGSEFIVRLEGGGFPTRNYPIQLQAGVANEAQMAMMTPEKAAEADAVDAFNRGVSLLQGGRELDALPLFKQAAELNPNLPDAQRIVAAISATTDDPASGLPYLDRYLQMNPTDPAIPPVAYQILRHVGDGSRAKQYIDAIVASGDALDIAPNIYNEAVALVKGEDLDGAKKLFREALALNPKLHQAHRSLAAIAFNAEEYEEALPDLRKTLELDPRNSEAHRLHFYSHLTLENWDEAKEAGKGWVGVKPDASADVLEQADRYFRADDRAMAQSYLEVVLAMDPGSAGAHYTLGRLHFTEDPAKAKQHLEKFLELDPSHSEAATAKELLGGLQ